MQRHELEQALEDLHVASFGWALLCCGRVRSEAEDVLQTTYVKVLSGEAEFSGRSSLKTWLFAVIRNTARDRRRREWTRRAIQWVIRSDEDAARAGFRPPPDAPGESDPLERERFLAALGRLPVRQRDVIELVFYQDFTIEEAARILGISVGSARVHYDRGKKRMKVELGLEDDDETSR